MNLDTLKEKIEGQQGKSGKELAELIAQQAKEVLETGVQLCVATGNMDELDEVLERWDETVICTVLTVLTQLQILLGEEVFKAKVLARALKICGKPDVKGGGQVYNTNLGGR